MLGTPCGAGGAATDAAPPDTMPPDTMPAWPAKPRRTLPRANGWLARMAPDLVPYGIEIAYFLAQPDMIEMLATSPRLWRALRPLCRMFGITPPQLPPPASDAPDAPPRRAPSPGRVAARLRRRSEAAAIREHGPRGHRPSSFDR